MTQQENHANADKLSIQKIIFFVNDSVSIRQEATFCVERWRERNVFCTERESFGFSGKCFTGRRCSLLTDKREPERTAVPGGHESPSGAFKPQTGLFFALLRFEGPSAAAAAAPRRGAGCALSVTFGDTLSPFLSLRDIFPRPGEVFQRERQEALSLRPWLPFKRKARSVPSTLLALPPGELANPKGLTERAKGSPFGRAGAKRLRGFASRRAAGSPLARCSHREPAAADAVCRYDSSREKTKKKSPQAFLFLQIKNNFSAMIVRAKRRQF